VTAGNLNIYSIGHSNHPGDKFLQLLCVHHIQCLVDVRSIPYSRYNPQYNRKTLDAFLRKNNIEYIWMGDSLGGRRKDSTPDTKHEHAVLYQKGIQDLMAIAANKTTAFMCSEEDPRRCHRHRMISNTIMSGKITGNGTVTEIKINHIRATGEIEDASKIVIAMQQKLF